jgi:hypothetical protein
MPMKVTSLSDPGGLNTPGGKAAFYICHVLPEWLASLTLFSDNIRKSFGTGLFGDYRVIDETESQKISRHAKEAKRKAKNANNTSSAVGLVERKEKV